MMTESARALLDDMTTRYQGVPILSLAQTALWDDPVKALLKELLDLYAPQTRLILGVMDTDYLSRLPRQTGSETPFDVLPHNDGSTRDFWAAVGEMSCLLGAETPLPVSVLGAEGVRRCQAMASLGSPACREFIDTVTEAWGWRGLAQTRGRRVLAGDVSLRDVGEPLLRQVEWALSETARVADRPLGPFADRMRNAIAAYVRAHPEQSLADVYLAFLPLLYSTLLGYAPEGLEYTRSSELLRFNRWTANRARFRPVDLFLNPKTESLARRHYDAAVRDSGISTLDRFGPHAVPFDLAIPGHGRGTLHISDTEIHVDTDDPVAIPLTAPIRDRRRLAVVLEEHLGPGVALLGKAVALITMLAGEYIFLFNETGSPYVPSSRLWNDLLTADGAGLRLYPILRLGTQPWDNIATAGGHLALPPHIARAFGAARVSAADFQDGWRAAVQWGRDALETIRGITRTADWLDYLAAEDPGGEWSALAADYRALLAARAAHGERIRAIKAESDALLQRIRDARAEVDALQKAKGAHFRTCIRPLRESRWQSRHGEGEDADWTGPALAEEMERREAMDRDLRDRRAAIGEMLAAYEALAERRRALTEDPEVAARNAALHAIEGRAEREKALHVRDAWMTAEALTHTQPRPTAWWFPVVDPSGAWFRAVTETAEFRWQELEVRDWKMDPAATPAP
jgi:hypothetical protein